ncbi:MAG: DUF3592 domain-containing protein [Bacteroidia bacterium]|nr:DUF3592 domain-containing protein [Bacteroidia bacterium]
MPHEQHVKETVKMLQKGRLEAMIKLLLEDKGLNEEEISQVLDQANAIYLQRSLWIKRLGFLALSVVILLFFLNAIPVTWDMSAIFVSLIGGGLLATTLSYAISSFMFGIEKNTLKRQKQWRGKTFGFFVFIGIVAGAGFAVNHGMAQDSQLDEDGILAYGVIVDGHSQRVKRTTTYTLKIKFKTKSGKEHTSKASVSERTFSNSAIGQQVPIVYSASRPGIIKMITSRELLEKYME